MSLFRQKTENAPARFLQITKVVSFDKTTHSSILYAKPFGGTSSVRIEGVVPMTPIASHNLKVYGELQSIEEEAKDGTRTKSLLFKNPKIEPLGQSQHLFGKITKVFAAYKESKTHPASSIALVQALGRYTPQKVYANAYLEEGNYINCEGAINKVAAFRWVNGIPVEELYARDGTRIYYLDFHANHTTVCHTPTQVQATITEILKPRDCFGLCEVNVTLANHSKPIPTTLRLQGETVLREGDQIRMKGFCIEEPLNQDAPLRRQTTLTFKAVEHELILPQKPCALQGFDEEARIWHALDGFQEEAYSFAPSQS